MRLKRLILMLVALLWAAAGAQAAPAVPGGAAIDVSPAVDLPQWRDIGMYDVLAVVTGSTVAPPSSVRLVHDTPQATAAAQHAARTQRYATCRAYRLASPSAHRGYIYLIRCLRL